MAKVENNVILHGVSGKLGDNVVFRKLKNGKILMVNKPKRRKGNSELQQKAIDHFKEAMDYATAQMKDPERKALYEKGINDDQTSAHAVAKNDWFNAPVIKDITADNYTGAPGEMIRVWATDDFRVESVTVAIFGADGSVVETGSAVLRGKKGLWRMTTTIQNPQVDGTIVGVEVKDYAGNSAVGTMEL